VDLVWGLVFGLVFSFLALALVWHIQKSKIGMNRRQKIGLFVGIPLSLIWIVIILKLCEVF
jgi:hypothetical protein